MAPASWPARGPPRHQKRDQARHSVPVEDCNQPDHKKLIEGLCAEKGNDLSV
jgi:hypothetical protein